MKTSQKGFIGVMIVIFAVILLLCLIVYLKQVTHVKKDSSNSEQKSVSTVVDNQSTHHRLESCNPYPGKTIQDRENFYINSTSTYEGYKVLLNCAHAENVYDPNNKNEYFLIRDTVRNIDYYVIDGYQRVLGDMYIIGIKDNLLFYNFCWEGCSTPEYFELSLTEKDKAINVYPERTDVLYRQGVPPRSELLIHKNRGFFIGEHDIFELNTKNFSLTKVKTIAKDKFFASYDNVDGHYSTIYPVVEKTDTGLLIKIYDDVSKIDIDTSKLETYFLKI